MMSRGLMPADLWFEDYCLETGYTPAEVRAMPNWFVSNSYQLILKRRIVEAQSMAKSKGTP
jgi:hypothetical protein